MTFDNDALTILALRILAGATAALVLALTAAWGMRAHSAAFRSRLLGLGLAACLALPVAVAVLPARSLGWLPARVVAIPASESRPMQIAGASQAGPVSLDRALPAGPDNLAPAPRSDSAEATNAAADVREAAATPSETKGATRLSAFVTACLAIWGLGALAFLIRLALSHASARRLACKATPITDLACLELMQRLARSIGIANRAMRLLESADGASPYCLGWPRHSLVLPAQWRAWPADHLRAALSHELAHVARGDVMWQYVAQLACAAYWFHPLAWVAAWRLRVERETACDDCVLNAGQPAVDYARLLLAVAANLAGRTRAVEPCSVAMASPSIEKRIRAVLQPNACRAPLGRRASRTLAAGVLGALALLGLLNPWSEPGGNDTTEVNAAEAQADGKEKATPDEAPADDPSKVTVRGQVVDEQDNPVAGATVALSGFPPKIALTQADGLFRFQVEFRAARYLTVRAFADDGARQAFFHNYDEPVEDLPTESLRLELRPARRLEAIVQDAAGQPVAGATVGATAYYAKVGSAVTDGTGRATLLVPVTALLSATYALKDQAGLDFFTFRQGFQLADDPSNLPQGFAGPLTFTLAGARSVTVDVVDEKDRQLANTGVRPWFFARPNKKYILNIDAVDDFARHTNDQGAAEFAYLPNDLSQATIFWVVAPERYSLKRPIFDPKMPENKVLARVVPYVPVTGQVVDADGRPAAGVEVLIGSDVASPSPMQIVDVIHSSLRTGADGTFRFDVYSNQYYLIAARHGRLAAKPQTMVVRQQPVQGLKFVLGPATRIRGKLTKGRQQDPWGDQTISLTQFDQTSHDNLPANERLPDPPGVKKQLRPAVVSFGYADAQGQFEFFVGPGEFSISGPPGAGGSQLTVTDQAEIEVKLWGEPPADQPVR